MENQLIENQTMEGQGKYKKIWNIEHQKKHTWLYNYVSDLPKYKNKKLNKDTFVFDLKRELGKIVEESHWGPGSREGQYFTIARFLEMNYPNDTQAQRYVKIYQQKGYEYKKQVEKSEGKNELSDKEKESYRDYEYFENILKQELEKPDDTKIENHYQKLLLATVVLQPPVRTSFYSTARFIDKIKDNDKLKNSVHINRQGKGNVYFNVNDDKVKNSKAVKKDPTLSRIKIESQQLTDLIIDSYTRYPRTYLFENPHTKKPYKQGALLRMLHKITKLPAINIRMMRSIYITWSHNSKPQHEHKLKLAQQMRHSLDTASKNYNKPGTRTKSKEEKENETINDLKAENKEITKENEKLKAELKNVIEHCGAFNSDDKLYIKRRADILYRYNKKGVEPTEKTMKKYNITLKNNVYV